MHPQPYEIICYHCQQAVEKYLKAYLLYNGIKPPRSHDLDQLCEMCQEYEADFEAIHNQCATLTQYGTQPRYPYEIEIFERHMTEALAFARQVKQFEPLAFLRRKLTQETEEKMEDEKSDGPELTM